MNQPYSIPVGFRFEPSNEELIKGFLIPKVNGLPLPWDGIVEKEVYGGDASPWDVFRDIDDDNSPSLYCSTTTKKTIYVFTKVMKAALNAKKRVSRSAGCGTWSGQTGSKRITDSTTGEVIGFTKMLSYKHRGGDGDQVFGHWIMHEYSLTEEWSNEFVLCRITRCMKDSDHRRTQLSSPAMVDERELEPNNKKQKYVGDEGFNSRPLTVEDMLMEDGEGCTLTVEDMLKENGEGCTLTVEDVDRILMVDDDLEGVDGTLAAEEYYAAFERVMMDGGERSNEK